MSLRLCFLVFILCALIGTSDQQKKKLRKRLGYVESVIGGINMMVGRTQMDITELQEAVELLQNRSDDSSQCNKDQPPINATAITELETKLKQQEVKVNIITKAFNDEKAYVRERKNEISVIKSELMESKKVNEKLREQIQATNQVNNKLTLELQKVQADLMKMKNEQTKQVEEYKDEMIIMKQLMMEMQQNITECCTATTTPTRQTTTEPTTTTTATARIQTTTTTEPPTTTVPEVLSPCPTGWTKFQRTCYLYMAYPEVSFYGASMGCFTRGGKLAKPDTREKLQFLDQLRAGWCSWCTDRRTEVGTWVWTRSGIPVDSSLWAPGQPETYRGHEDCIFMAWGELYDRMCTGKLSYMCERKVSG